jgi:hypothetical protein
MTTTNVSIQLCDGTDQEPISYQGDSRFIRPWLDTHMRRQFSRDGSIKPLSERLAEDMSSEFPRMQNCQNSAVAKEFFDSHEKFTKFIPGYKEEFEKIKRMR